MRLLSRTHGRARLHVSKAPRQSRQTPARTSAAHMAVVDRPRPCAQCTRTGPRRRAVAPVPMITTNPLRDSPTYTHLTAVAPPLVSRRSGGTRETTTRKRPPPRDRFDKISLATTEAVSFLEEHGVANERTGRENAATTASINAVEINSRAKQMNHREKQAEQEERRWRTMATTTTSNVAESLKVSKLEIELERLEAQVRVMKKDVRMARADCARERQTVAHERRRCEE